MSQGGDERRMRVGKFEELFFKFGNIDGLRYPFGV